MASLGHVAVGIAAARAHAGGLDVARPSLSAYVAFAALALLPDADVLAFGIHVPYAAKWGHRGAAHSLAIAAVVVVGLVVLVLRSPRTGFYAAAVVASHGLLDALTDGGLGVALLWPASHARYFAPWRPIPVAPIGARMLSARGLHVVLVEALASRPLTLYALSPSRTKRAG